jgi:hypothetical protein
MHHAWASLGRVFLVQMTREAGEPTMEAPELHFTVPQETQEVGTLHGNGNDWATA